MTFSIIQKSQLEGALRLDAEYYQPEYLELTSNLNKLGAVPIKQIAINPKRKFYSKKDKSFNYIEISEVNLNTGEYEKTRIIGSERPDRAQWVVKKDDVIISTVRPIRNAVSLIDNEDRNLVCSSGFAVLKSKIVEPEYLFLYLKAKPIIKLLDRQNAASMYPAVTIDDILNIKIYLGSQKFRGTIKSWVIEANKELSNSRIYYQQAENLLLNNLGLDHIDAEKKLFSVIKYSDCQEANRIDAEYFQPSFLNYENILSKYKTKQLNDLCSLISYGTVPTSPYSETGVPYVKGMNLKECFIDHSEIDYLDSDSTLKLPSRFRLEKDDIIISQMGTVGNAAIAEEDEKDWLFASFTIRARLSEESKKVINPLYLTLYINKIAKPYYLMRHIAQSSVRQNTDLPTIRNMPVPFLPKATQDKIADLVRKSHTARRESKQLLEKAKSEVENIIEKGSKGNGAR